MVSVSFAPGTRPRACDIAALAADEGSFTVSHMPAESEGWVELLINGLTFDLTGLAPTPAAEPPLVRHRYGIKEQRPVEGVALAPGPHISAGRTLPPVIRAGASLAVSLCRLAGAELVSWHAARNAIVKDAFVHAVSAWLNGGAFPSFSLASIYTADGRTCSEGLKLFTGQELRLDGGRASPADDAKLALRLLEFLVRSGRLSEPVTCSPDDLVRVRLEPIGRGDLVRAWRQSD